MKKTVYFIDGSAYIYRAYHAIRNLSNSEGLPTNAVFGFTKMILKLMDEKKPEFLAVMFDVKGPTFRHEIYKDYKANRPPMPDDLAVQVPIIKDIVRGFNLKIFEKQGFEADDLIGTLSSLAENAGFSVVMVTGDKDFLQLVTDDAVIWDPMKNIIMDKNTVKEKFGIEPEQVIDAMGLSGDTADNIPGVPGVGPKTAASLVQEFGSMENLYEHVGTITKKKQKENLLEYRDQAFLSRKLVTINKNIPIDFDPDVLKVQQPDEQVLSDIFKKLEFRQLHKNFSVKNNLSEKKYKAILDMDALKDLVRYLEKTGLFAFDTETTSKRPVEAELVGLSFSCKKDEAFYIPVGHADPGESGQLDCRTVLDALTPVLTNPDIGKVGQNIKYDWIVLLRYGIDLKGIIFDTMLASYLLNPSRRVHSLDQIALDLLDHQMISYKEVTENVQKGEGFREVPLLKAVPYACEDADITLSAFHVLLPMIEKAGLKELLDTVEMPLVPVLMSMEMRGICIDTKKRQELSISFEKRLLIIEKSIYVFAGEEFNIRSSQQLGRILFEKLKLPVVKKTKKKTGYSTDVDVLTQLSDKHELPELVLQHRTLSKLKSTYTDALLGLVSNETGRIHTSYNQTVTATGRLSSSEPNLQNIPIRGEEGREIRKAFVPKKGWHLVSADYSQIELRILAHCSEDPILIKAFVNDEDIHVRTAAEVFQYIPSLITPEVRQQAKAINFGIIYGMSPFGLSKVLRISQKMAKNYIDGYFARYQGVKRFIDRTIAKTVETKQSNTLLNRIRPLPDISSSNRNLRQFAERVAINTPIQGSAADLIKIAMIKVDEAFLERNLKAAMLLSVHDELIFEVPPDELETVMMLVRKIMEEAWDLRVPLKVNIACGKNWSEAH
ncbi:MAG: DNA polymerase I [Deltaproteobacteria bacterium]|nr:DNA polymerase I [Deltaproteobacteria bacterium]